eukprot:TRINITY_DN937_c1_g1_i1.p2 TRINITY_DN937_c1_g1~~TRINITY_DN937_c1_g1_i1.p2  ORF type:complete len:104 (+),score=3.35 TRINITY_DN937_c1_g1_i1:122-433(+)
MSSPFPFLYRVCTCRPYCFKAPLLAVRPSHLHSILESEVTCSSAFPLRRSCIAQHSVVVVDRFLLFNVIEVKKKEKKKKKKEKKKKKKKKSVCPSPTHPIKNK